MCVCAGWKGEGNSRSNSQTRIPTRGCDTHMFIYMWTGRRAGLCVLRTLAASPSPVPASSEAERTSKPGGCCYSRGDALLATAASCCMRPASRRAGSCGRARFKRTCEGSGRTFSMQTHACGRDRPTHEAAWRTFRERNSQGKPKHRAREGAARQAEARTPTTACGSLRAWVAYLSNFPPPPPLPFPREFPFRPSSEVPCSGHARGTTEAAKEAKAPAARRRGSLRSSRRGVDESGGNKRRRQQKTEEKKEEKEGKAAAPKRTQEQPGGERRAAERRRHGDRETGRREDDKRGDDEEEGHEEEAAGRQTRREGTSYSEHIWRNVVDRIHA